MEPKTGDRNIRGRSRTLLSNSLSNSPSYVREPNRDQSTGKSCAPIEVNSSAGNKLSRKVPDSQCNEPKRVQSFL